MLIRGVAARRRGRSCRCLRRRHDRTFRCRRVSVVHVVLRNDALLPVLHPVIPILELGVRCIAGAIRLLTVLTVGWIPVVAIPRVAVAVSLVAVVVSRSRVGVIVTGIALIIGVAIARRVIAVAVGRIIVPIVIRVAVTVRIRIRISRNSLRSTDTLILSPTPNPSTGSPTAAVTAVTATVAVATTVTVAAATPIPAVSRAPSCDRPAEAAATAASAATASTATAAQGDSRTNFRDQKDSDRTHCHHQQALALLNHDLPPLKTCAKLAAEPRRGAWHLRRCSSSYYQSRRRTPPITITSPHGYANPAPNNIV